MIDKQLMTVHLCVVFRSTWPDTEASEAPYRSDMARTPTPSVILLALLLGANLHPSNCAKLLSLTTLTDGIYPIVFANFSDGLVGMGQASYGGDAATTQLIVDAFHSLVAPYAIGKEIDAVADIVALQSAIIWESYKVNRPAH